MVSTVSDIINNFQVFINIALFFYDAYFTYFDLYSFLFLLCILADAELYFFLS